MTLWSHVRLVALATALALGGCAQSQDAMDSVSGAISKLDPFGAAKKPLPGQRKALFPEGVPGVQQGIPEDLRRGAQPPPVETVGAAPATQPAPAPVARPARAADRSRQKRVRTTAAPPTRQPARPRRAPATQADPAPDEVWPPPPRTTSGTPARSTPARQPAAAPAAQPQPQPAAPAGGGGTWGTPGAQPVPTQWPDPPKPQ